MTPSNLRRFTVTETRQAVEVTAENLDEVAAWAHGVVDDDGCVVVLAGVDHEDVAVFAVAAPGDVLVTDGTRWWDVTREEFERDSEQWVEETT